MNKTERHGEELYFRLGEEFEKYVQRIIFPKSDYDLVEISPNYDQNSERFVESSLNPDFKFRVKSSKQTFWVEAKFRSHFTKGKVQWCKDGSQLKRYRQAVTECPLFLALAIWGKPNRPTTISLIPIRDRFYYKHFFINEIEPYSIHPEKGVNPGHLHQLLCEQDDDPKQHYHKSSKKDTQNDGSLTYSNAKKFWTEAEEAKYPSVGTCSD